MSIRTTVGEIVTAEYNNFCAESFELNQAPPLGGLVVADGVVGLLYSVHTERLGDSRRKGDGTGDEDAVYKQHPELKFILRTQFTSLCLGCYDGLRPQHFYPERPPRIHYPVYLLAESELLTFTAKPTYLRAALNANEPSVDQAIIRLLYKGYQLRGAEAGWAYLLDASEFLGRLLKGQYNRLLAILETLEEVIGDKQPAQRTEIVRGVGNLLNV